MRARQNTACLPMRDMGLTTLSSAAKRPGTALCGWHHLGRSGLAPWHGTVAAQTLQGHGTPSGDATAQHQKAAGERQVPRAGFAQQCLAEHQLARGYQRASDGPLCSCEVRYAGGNVGKARLLPQQWLLIEWPAGQAEPEKYYLSTLPETTALNDLVRTAHMRWRIERDYQDLKQDMGLGHYEGRGWRGFHHHASMSIAAYGFLMAQRLKAGDTSGGKKNFTKRQVPAVSEDYVPRGSPARATPRTGFDHLVTSAHKRSARQQAGLLSTLQLDHPTSALD